MKVVRFAIKQITPYGLMCVWLKWRHGVELDKPLLFYPGWIKRVRRVFKFSLPYGLVMKVRQPTSTKRLLPAFLVNWIKSLPAYELYGMRHSPLAAPFAERCFPRGTEELSCDCSSFRSCGRTAVFAMFSKDGRISDADVYYLRGLSSVADNIVVIGDCPIFPAEVSKIAAFVNHCEFVRHGEYDFGSYKRGLGYVRARLDLNGGAEIILCNNSCYGPVVPFKIMFDKMRDRDCDFWGVCESFFYRHHIQSYFVVFRDKVIRSGALDDFLSRIRPERSVMDVILKYEIGLTQALARRGFVGIACFEQDAKACRGDNPTSHPATLIAHGCPLVKIKALCSDECNHDGIQRTLEILRSKNPELYGYVRGEGGVA